MPASSELATLVRLPEDVALHARPAGAFVREAARVAAEIRVEANGRSANAKSILDILALGATGGTELVISASGPDAAEALERLVGARLRPRLSERARPRRRRNWRASASRASAAARSSGDRPDDRLGRDRRVAGATLSSSTPSPTKSTTSSGTPAASPQTSTVIPTSCAAAHDRRDVREHRRIGRGRGRGERQIAVERERARHEVVRPDREEVRLERDLRRAPRSLRRLDHRSELDRRLLADRVAKQRPHDADLLRRLDERQEDPQVRLAARADDRAQLRRERLRVGERQRQSPLPACRRGTAASCPLRSRACARSRRGRGAAASSGASAAQCCCSVGQADASRKASSVRRRPTPAAPGSEPGVDLRRRGGVAEERDPAAVERLGRQAAQHGERAAAAPALAHGLPRRCRARPRAGSTERTPSSPSRTSMVPSAIAVEIGSERRPPSARRASGRRSPRAPSPSLRRARRRRCGLPRARAPRSRPGRDRARRGSSRPPGSGCADVPSAIRAARRPSSRTSEARAASIGSGERCESAARTPLRQHVAPSAGASRVPSSRTLAASEGSSAIRRFASRISASSARPALAEPLSAARPSSAAACSSAARARPASGGAALGSASRRTSARPTATPGDAPRPRSTVRAITSPQRPNARARRG